MGFLRDAITNLTSKSSLDYSKKIVKERETIINCPTPNNKQEYLKELYTKKGKLNQVCHDIKESANRAEISCTDASQLLTETHNDIDQIAEEIQRLITETSSLNDQYTKMLDKTYTELIKNSLNDMKEMLDNDVDEQIEIDARYGIGMIKLALRCKDPNDVKGILDILQNYKYHSHDREFLNRVRKTAGNIWLWDNMEAIRTYCIEHEQIKIWDIKSNRDNKWGTSSPEELSMNYRSEYLRANLVVIINSDIEEINIIKSRYFNTPIKTN